MNYQDVMHTLSQCGIGVIVLTNGDTISEINEAGDHLLRGNGCLVGKRLSRIAPELCEPAESGQYANIAFGKYVMRCPAPDAEGLPPSASMTAFTDASVEAQRDMLLCVVNQVSEGVIICDTKNRICYMNDSTIKMDSIVAAEVIGKDIRDVYFTHDHSELLVPSAIRDKVPLRNVRQYYKTQYGKDVDIVSNSFPILKKKQVLGGFSLMEDWAMVDHLHKQILDLQQKLTAFTRPNRKIQAKSALTAKYNFSDIVHASTSMREVINHCKQAALSDSSVMIYGETGTGKELFAQSIHNASRRANGPFLAINCAALPENLLESLLFGTEKGSYTGAESRAGLFEQANHGTLLLDEINSMNISIQSKLLRVLQDGKIRRVGGSSETYVDVRVLSNINIPPHQAIMDGHLRKDLFYRLGVVNVTIPPLRERQEDIALLAKYFIMHLNKKMGKNVLDLDADALTFCLTYPWPGNVRELQHVIEHAMNILPADDSVISSKYIYVLPENGSDTQSIVWKAPSLGKQKRHTVSEEQPSLNSHIRSLEYDTICKVLQAYGGNITKSAEFLKMSRQSLQYRIKRYQIDIKALIRESCQELNL